MSGTPGSGSGEPDEIERQLRASLSLAGATSAHIDDLVVSADAWREAAGAAGRTLARPVMTAIVGGSVHAVLRDWPITADEIAKDRAAIRSAVDEGGRAV